MFADNNLRIFFALWPDQQLRDQIVDRLRPIDFDLTKSRLVTEANLHMTLHFIGNTTAPTLDCLDRQARQIQFKPFDMQLDSMGVFEKPRVLWLGCDNPPTPLIELQGKLGQRFTRCGFTPEARAFTPHVTVARKFANLTQPVEISPICWRVEGFALVVSKSRPTGVHYEVLSHYS